jgi:hypothetical protein
MAIVMLHTRAAPRPHIHDDWVDWLVSQHMPQLTGRSSLLGSWCYRSLPGRNTTRQHYMVNYVAPDAGSMMTWLESRASMCSSKGSSQNTSPYSWRREKPRCHDSSVR